MNCNKLYPTLVSPFHLLCNYPPTHSLPLILYTLAIFNLLTLDTLLIKDLITLHSLFIGYFLLIRNTCLCFRYLALCALVASLRLYGSFKEE